MVKSVAIDRGFPLGRLLFQFMLKCLIPHTFLGGSIGFSYSSKRPGKGEEMILLHYRFLSCETWIPRRSRRLRLSSARYLMGFFPGPWESEPELVSKRCVLAYSRSMAICSGV